jgi:hypothetical protein
MKRRRLALLAAATALAASLTVAGTATATPSSPATGTQEFGITIVERLAGPNIVTRIHSTGTTSGTFSGTTTGDFMEVVRASGDSRIHGFVTCLCTVEGRTGTVVFANVASASFDPVTFEFLLLGRVVAIQASGELEGLHAQLDVVFDGRSTTYTGSYHFD